MQVRSEDHQLRQIFPEGQIYAVSDDERLLAEAARYGLAAVPLAGELPRGGNVVLFLRQSMISAALRRDFKDMAVLVVPIASFDASLEAALYTTRLTMLTDYRAACERSRYWADAIQGGAGTVVFSSDRTHIECALADELSADAWLRDGIVMGQWVSIGTLCEFSMTPPSLTDWSGAFTVDGTAVAAGVLAARDARSTAEGDARIDAARRLREDLTTNAPIVLELVGGVLTCAESGGRDYTDAIREVTNPEYGLHLIELGIGTNQGVLPHVDWSFNSQLNEGAGPVHLGFGDGITGAHMDFVVADGTHRIR